MIATVSPTYGAKKSALSRSPSDNCRASKGRADNCDRCLDVAQHEHGVDTHHPVAEPAKLLLATEVRRATGAMNSAVDLHNEPNRRCEEISDVAVPDGNL